MTVAIAGGTPNAQRDDGPNEEQTATLETALLHAAAVGLGRAGPDANRSAGSIGPFAFGQYALGFFVVAKHRKTLSGKP